jgi:hypothetical protein
MPKLKAASACPVGDEFHYLGKGQPFSFAFTTSIFRFASRREQVLCMLYGLE